MNLNNGYKNQKDSNQNTLESFKILISNIKYLKDKTWGCPWQKIQSHKSLIPFLNEESSELIDAIYEKNANNICEELGDLLLQIMLHSEIGFEEKQFELKDVIENLGGIKVDSMEDACRDMDAISLHIPLTDKTRI